MYNDEQFDWTVEDEQEAVYQRYREWEAEQQAKAEQEFDQYKHEYLNIDWFLTRLCSYGERSLTADSQYVYESGRPIISLL